MYEIVTFLEQLKDIDHRHKQQLSWLIELEINHSYNKHLDSEMSNNLT